LVAVTVWPLLAVSPSALSGGYGRQSQLVPRGTESPNATIDHVRGAVDAPVEEVVTEEAELLCGDDDPQAAVRPSSAITTVSPPGRRSQPASPTSRRRRTVAVILTEPSALSDLSSIMQSNDSSGEFGSVCSPGASAS
jgi:hypothetical protein